jgi:hypothetical protein
MRSVWSPARSRPLNSARTSGARASAAAATSPWTPGCRHRPRSAPRRGEPHLPRLHLSELQQLERVDERQQVVHLEVQLVAQLGDAQRAEGDHDLGQARQRVHACVRQGNRRRRPPHIRGRRRWLLLFDSIGCRGLLVHAESEEVRDFYLHLVPEFEQSPTDDLHLVLLMKDIRRALLR